MKSRKTHNKITKALLPYLDPKVIDEVNKAIDSPDPVAKLVSAITGQASKDNPLMHLPYRTFLGKSIF